MRIYQLISGNRAYVDSLNESGITGSGWRMRAAVDDDGQVGDDEVRLITPEGEILFRGRIDGNTLTAVKGQIKLDMIGQNKEPKATPLTPGKPAYRATTCDPKVAKILANYAPTDWTVHVDVDARHHWDKVQVFLGEEAVGHVPVLPYNSIPGMVNNLIKRDVAKRQAPPPAPTPSAEQVAAAQPARSAREVGKVTQEAPPPAGQDEPIYEIPLGKIGHFPGGNQRTVFDQVKLEELAASIRTHGVAEPILVNEMDGNYLLIAGERRLRASHMAGKPTIPARVRHLSEAEALELMAVENLQREDLNPIDEARAYQRLLQVHGSRERVADRVGMSRVRVTEHLQLLELPSELQQQVATGQLSVRAGLDYLRRTKEAPAPVREKVAQVLAEEKPTARQAPQVIDRVLEQEGVARATPPKKEQLSTKPAATSTTETKSSPAREQSTTTPTAPAKPSAPEIRPEPEAIMGDILLIHWVERDGRYYAHIKMAHHVGPGAVLHSDSDEKAFFEWYNALTVTKKPMPTPTEVEI